MTAEGDLGAIASNPYEITKASEPWLKKNTVIVVNGSHQIHPGKSLAGMKIWFLFASTCIFFSCLHILGMVLCRKASLVTPCWLLTHSHSLMDPILWCMHCFSLMDDGRPWSTRCISHSDRRSFDLWFYDRIFPGSWLATRNDPHMSYK